MDARGLKAMRIAALCLAVLLLPEALAQAAGDAATPTSKKAETTAPADAAAPDSTIAGTEPNEATAVPPPDRVVLYYFHRTARCDNCVLFEAYTASLVHAAFQPELSSGVLEWHVVNLDEDGNDVFVDRYALEGITLLSTVVVDGEERDSRPLDAIWWLVDDRQAFADYVASEIEADLETMHGKRTPEAADSLPLHRELVPESGGGGLDAAPQR